jgi:organic hydroperoxide reductase OsmC/OhrA
MSGKQHHYQVEVKWTGNKGEGTKTYRSYGRDHAIETAGKPAIAGSSDPAFRGDKTRHNPEDLLVASLSACHMLAYLHLCAVNGVVVMDYIDSASGVMEQTENGGGHFVSVTLKPRVTISEGDPALAQRLHENAHHICFIASSVNFPVETKAEILEVTATREGM